MNWEASGPRHFDRERIHILTSSAPDRIRSELRLSKKDAFFLLRPNLNLRNRNQHPHDDNSAYNIEHKDNANLSTRKSLFTCTYRFVVAGRGLRSRTKKRRCAKYDPLAIKMSWAASSSIHCLLVRAQRLRALCTLNFVIVYGSSRDNEEKILRKWCLYYKIR